jgi:hypothetical protein
VAIIRIRIVFPIRKSRFVKCGTEACWARTKDNILNDLAAIKKGQRRDFPHIYNAVINIAHLGNNCPRAVSGPWWAKERHGRPSFLKEKEVRILGEHRA